MDTRKRLGNIHITEGCDACIAEIKRLYRAALHKRRSCTIGFLLRNKTREYCYCRAFMVYDDDLPGKLSIYKELKQYLLSRGCKFEEFRSALLGADYTPERVETHYQMVDLTHPIKIYFVD
jgi:hypothetical protein